MLNDDINSGLLSTNFVTSNRTLALQAQNARNAKSFILLIFVAFFLQSEVEL